MTDLSGIKVGDTVTRMLAGTIPVEVKVAHIDDRFIYCGPEWDFGNPVDPDDYPGWKFDKTFGYEVDEGIGWGAPQEDGRIITGSFIREAGWEKDAPGPEATR